MTAPGHNSALADEVRNKALFFYSKAKYSKALDAKKAADAAFKNACKAIKADGVEIDDIKFSIKADADEDGEIAAVLRRRIEIMRWVNHPLGHQFNFLDEPPPDRTPLIEKAKSEGFEAGASNREQGDNPYAPGDDGYQPWLQGWHLGSEAVFDLQGHIRGEQARADAAAADQSAGAKPRRGRPPGSKNKPKADEQTNTAASEAGDDDLVPHVPAVEERVREEPSVSGTDAAPADVVEAVNAKPAPAEDFPTIPDFLQRRQARGGLPAAPVAADAGGEPPDDDL